MPAPPAVARLAPRRLAPSLVQRFDRPGPRYTSYPTADRFQDGFGAAGYEQALERANRGSGALGAYLHLPFCEALCHYCACNVVITKNDAVRARYMERLGAEIAMVAARLPQRRALSAIHLGGGTPNSFDDDSLSWLIDRLGDHFELAADADLSIEVDPRHATPARIRRLRAMGFTRLSMGIQTFDPQVQEAVARRCTFGHVRALVDAAREADYDGVNLDLIYGLPHQEDRGFGRTLKKVIALKPDRIALYSFAFLPDHKKHQRAIDAAALPAPAEKLRLFSDAWSAFAEADYLPIGMDHFALPHDSLARAHAEGTLRRNFQGYSSDAPDEMIGFGVSAIGDIGGAYVQNAKTVRSWSEAIDAGQLAARKGLRRTADDEARRWIIHELMCRFQVRDDDLFARFGTRLRDYPEALALLHANDDLGDLVEVGAEVLTVTPLGRVFVRAVAAVFDRYLQERRPTKASYSRVV